MSVDIESSLFTGLLSVDNDDEGNTILSQTGGVVKLTRRQAVELGEVLKVIIDRSDGREIFEKGEFVDC